MVPKKKRRNCFSLIFRYTISKYIVSFSYGWGKEWNKTKWRLCTEFKMAKWFCALWWLLLKEINPFDWHLYFYLIKVVWISHQKSTLSSSSFLQSLKILRNMKKSKLLYTYFLEYVYYFHDYLILPYITTLWKVNIIPKQELAWVLWVRSPPNIALCWAPQW